MEHVERDSDVIIYWMPDMSGGQYLGRQPGDQHFNRKGDLARGLVNGVVDVGHMHFDRSIGSPGAHGGMVAAP